MHYLLRCEEKEVKYWIHSTSKAPQ